MIIPNGMRDFTMDGDKGLVGLVKETQKPLLVQDAYKHPAFNPSIDKLTQYYTRSVLCVPVFNSQNDFVGVCQLINKKVLESLGWWLYCFTFFSSLEC